MTSEALKAPFPYFGGKSLIAPTVWRAFGEPKNYVEPFCGSLAVLLSRPAEQLVRQPIETVNDADGLLANFWRSMNRDPETVIQAAENPVNECDLHARHVWLVGNRERITERLMGDHNWCDPKAAGWWVWGLCCWIGSGWCNGDGPWFSVDGELKKSGNAGRGVNRQLPHLGNAGRGVNRQLPHLGNAGQGVNRQLPHLGNAGQGVSRQRYWLSTLIDRMLNVRVACGDWSRVVKSSVLHTHASKRGSLATTAVFFDPPYSVGSELYATGKSDVRNDVREWCEEHGSDKRLRVVLCGYDGEHSIKGWKVHRWKTRDGYAGTKSGGSKNSKRETLWLSPHCLPIS
jgi:site-specific DNA-adenine methylase